MSKQISEGKADVFYGCIKVLQECMKVLHRCLKGFTKNQLSRLKPRIVYVSAIWITLLSKFGEVFFTPIDTIFTL